MRGNSEMTTKPSTKDWNASEPQQYAVPSGQALSDPEIVQRIDAMIRELQLLREMVAARQPKKSETHLVEDLFGVLGNGSWAEYDSALDWERFNI
jgi:hypothetical protein